MTARKPTWLGVFAGMSHSLKVRQCGTCGAWVVQDRDGVYEDYDATILSPLEAEQALSQGRCVASIHPVFGELRLHTALSADEHDGFMCRHRCGAEVLGGAPTPETVPQIFEAGASGKPVLRKGGAR